MRKMAPPPHVTRIPAGFPRGATFNIVGPNHAAYVDVRVSNNIENGTSAARGQRFTPTFVYWWERRCKRLTSWSFIESRFRHSP